MRPPFPDSVLHFVYANGSWLAALLVVATLALVIIVRHERRQSRRLAERTKELELLSAELLRVNRMKSEFLANVSHELRTPLNAIVGFTDLLRDGVYGELSPRQAGPVHRIEASANHLRHLVDQILDLAKLAAGRLEIHTEVVDIRPFIIDVANEVEPLINEKALQFKIVPDETPLPKIVTDPTHLRQILTNLVGNAVKYTNAGAITIKKTVVLAADRQVPLHLRLLRETTTTAPTSQPHDWLTIEVTDTGIGIAPTDHARIFEEFEQVNAGPRGESMKRGTGLGLPISRRLARLLGGDITLESAIGKGATFTLWLPLTTVNTPPIAVTIEKTEI